MTFDNTESILTEAITIIQEWQDSSVNINEMLAKAFKLARTVVRQVKAVNMHPLLW